MPNFVEELAAKLGLEVDYEGFAKGFEAIEGLRLGLHAIEGIALAAGAALVGIVHVTAESALEMDRNAQKTGLARDAYQELSFAADQSEVSQDSLNIGLTHLSVTLENARHGSIEAAFAVRRLGLHMYDSAGKARPTDEILGDVAEKISRMPEGWDKAALAQQVFGRGGKELIPLLNKGRDGIGELRKAAYDYGVVLDEDTVAASKRWEEQQKHLIAALKGVRNAIGAAFLKRLGDLTDRIAEWIRVNRELIASKVIGFVDALRQLAEPLAVAINKIFIETDAWKYSLIALAAVLAFVNAPLLAIIGALLLIEDFYGFLQGKDSLIGTLIPKDEREAVLKFVDKVTDFLHLIRDSFKAAGAVAGSIAGGGSFQDVTQGLAEMGIGSKGSAVHFTPGAFVMPGGAGGAKVSIHQVIQTHPGMNTQEIADKSAEKIDDAMQRIHREAHSDVDQ